MVLRSQRVSKGNFQRGTDGINVHRTRGVQMANVYQCFPSQNHQRACSKYRFISLSPGDSDLVGPGCRFIITMSNQISNHSTVHCFSREVSKTEKPYTHHPLVGSAGIHTCVLTCFCLQSLHSCVVCILNLCVLLSVMGTITSKAKGKVPKRNLEETW